MPAGQAKNNIYFPFDVVNDNAIDVATEMVKELKNLDWEPFRIAEMIEKEVSTVVSTWTDLNSSKYQRQDCYKYEDGEYGNGEGHHRFYTFSSCSSSEDSLPQVSQLSMMTKTHEWLQDDLSDGTSSHGSSNSFNYSNIQYSPSNELRSGSRPKTELSSKSIKSTRFCPEQDVNQNWYKECHKIVNFSHPRKPLAAAQSFVDKHSQILHRSIVEELCKRGLSHTDKAIDDTGHLKSGHDYPEESPKFRERLGFKWP